MKKIITLALMAIATLTASATPEQTAQFSSVSIDAPVRLVIAHGPTYSINLMSRNEQLTTAVAWKVKDGKLYISARDLESLQYADGRVTVIITAPEGIDYCVESDMQQTSSKTIKRPHRFPFFRRHR